MSSSDISTILEIDYPVCERQEWTFMDVLVSVVSRSPDGFGVGGVSYGLTIQYPSQSTALSLELGIGS